MERRKLEPRLGATTPHSVPDTHASNRWLQAHHLHVRRPVYQGLKWVEMNAYPTTKNGKRKIMQVRLRLTSIYDNYTCQLNKSNGSYTKA